MSLCLTKHNAMKTCGSGGTIPRNLNFGTSGGEWSASCSGEGSRYPLDRSGWAQSRSGRGSEEKKYVPLSEMERRLSRPLLSNYTGSAIPAPKVYLVLEINGQR
jgi:hypothetical protein